MNKRDFDQLATSVQQAGDKARDRVESGDSGRESNAVIRSQGRTQPGWTFSTG